MHNISVLAFMLIAVTILAAWQNHRDKFTCLYCGTYKGHDDHCPYQGWS